MGPALYVLGDFGLSDTGGPVSLGSGGERLLALLAVRAGPVHRAQVAGTLWALTTAERASSNLRAVLARLPRPGGRALVTSRARQLQLADDVVVDLASARESMRRARAGCDAAADELCPQLDADLLPAWDED